MKKMLTIMMLGAAVFAFTGCGEKTEEEKATEAAAEMQKDAEKAASSLKQDADKAVEEGAKKLDGLLGK